MTKGEKLVSRIRDIKDMRATDFQYQMRLIIFLVKIGVKIPNVRTDNGNWWIPSEWWKLPSEWWKLP